MTPKSGLEGERSPNYHLILIGIGVFVCLIILTIISLLDLRRDMRKVPGGNFTAFTLAPESMGVCHFCGTKGIPQCFYCGVTMNWENSRGIYSCPRCRRLGPAHCPNCGTAMRPETVTPGAIAVFPTVNKGGMPVGGNPAPAQGIPEKKSKPASSYWDGGQDRLSWLLCPVCRYQVFYRFVVPGYRGRCPRCSAFMVGR